jgi:hypothetical protein
MKNLLKMKRVCWAGCALILLAGMPALAESESWVEVEALTVEYDRAVERGDLQKALRTQEEALKLWNTLDSREKARLNREHPGMFRWLQGGAAYDSDNNSRRAARYRRSR